MYKYIVHSHAEFSIKAGRRQKAIYMQNFDDYFPVPVKFI